MHPHADSPSFVERFLHSFFQEKNIKWMLVVGAAIVFGSSLMLVTKAWPDWSFSLKYLTVLGYTGLVFASSEFTRRRRRLRATYRVLQVLTMLLLPVCFLSLSWISPGTAVQPGLQWIRHAALLIPSIGLLSIASTRILDHWLTGRQTTFLISYNILCLLGAIPALTSPMLAIAFVMGAWLVFSAGVLKVNRHTFWLAEKHKLPRVFGFLPIGMLGLQLVVLVGTKAIGVLPAQWLGFGLVLVAATILITTRAIAEVFRQKTGDLTRPLPWEITVPSIVGLMVTFGGMALAMTGFTMTGASTYAILPSAIIAAWVLAVVTKDLNSRVLVWGSLVSIAIAYQCSPVLFSDAVHWFRDSAATAIGRRRVPLSLYGITYLPLLGTLATGHFLLARKQFHELAQPIGQFVTLVSLGLFAFAATDSVSLFVVSIANVVMFVGYAIAFRDRRYVVGSFVSLVAVVATFIPAGHSMSHWSFPTEWTPTCLAALACMMTLSRIPDRWINKIPMPRLENEKSSIRIHETIAGQLSQFMGCLLGIAMGVLWITDTVLATELFNPASLWQFAFLMTSILVYTFKHPRYWSAMGCWMIGGYAAVRGLLALEIGLVELASTLTFALILISALSYAVIRRIQRRMPKGRGPLETMQLRSLLGIHRGDSMGRFAERVLAFSITGLDLGVIGLLLLFGFFFVPAWVLATTYPPFALSGLVPLFAIASMGISGWFFAFAGIRRDRFIGSIAAIIFPVAITTLLTSIGFDLSFDQWLLVVCIVLGGSLEVSRLLLQRYDSHGGYIGIQKVSSVLLQALIVASCFSLDWPMRLAAIAAGVCLWRKVNRSNFANPVDHLVILLSVQTLLASAAAGGCRGWFPMGLLSSVNGLVLSLLLSASVAWILFFEHASQWIESARVRNWKNVLQGFTVLLLLGCLTPLTFGTLPCFMVAISMSCLIVHEIVKAVRKNQQEHVWIGFAIAGYLVGFLLYRDMFSLGIGWSQFVLLGMGLLAFGVIEIEKRWLSCEVLEFPMKWIGNTTPALVAVLAILREFTGHLPNSTPLCAMGLMIAAGIYFFRAIQGRCGIHAVGGLVLSNLALLFLWRSLNWFAPELYLVPIGISLFGLTEVMGDRLPSTAHNPLRYISVLAIMSSPMFEVIGGSWIHMLVLMILSVLVIFLAIGLRVRALVYVASASLLVDLVAMVVRSSIGNLNLLWIVGVGLGIAVIALAAVCENHRDKLLAKIRMLSAELATWS